jgi:hypothetical protein
MIVALRLISSHLPIILLFILLLLTFQNRLLFLKTLLPHYHIIFPFLGFSTDSVNRQTLRTLNQLTRTMGVNNFSLANATRKYTIKWKTLINLVAHTADEHLRITRNRLRKGTFAAVYCPMFREWGTFMGC